MKRIEDLQKIKGDAYDYYVASSEDTDLFEKIFLVDEIIDEIRKPDKYFLLGEKGSGKTAYSVYMSKAISTFYSDAFKPELINTFEFVDGIDARPKDIDNEQYFDCLVGLVNAVLERNQKLRGNSVLLNWVTSYRNYVS